MPTAFESLLPTEVKTNKQKIKTLKAVIFLSIAANRMTIANTKISEKLYENEYGFRALNNGIGPPRIIEMTATVTGGAKILLLSRLASA